MTKVIQLVIRSLCFDCGLLCKPKTRSRSLKSLSFFLYLLIPKNALKDCKGKKKVRIFKETLTSKAFNLFKTVECYFMNLICLNYRVNYDVKFALSCNCW